MDATVDLDELRADLGRGPGWASGRPGSGLPLADVRILDLSRVLAGPFATMVLGDLGADVLKIEKPDVGDDTRRWGPPFHGDDAAYFHSVNRNRRSVALDLKSDAGRTIVRHLVGHADVVVENFLPRHLASLGLDELRDDPEGPVWVSVRSASSSGPSGAEPGYDAIAQARGGLMSITGHEDSGPTKVGVAIADVVTGLYAAVAALSGLVARAAPDGRGRHFEVPLLESTVSALVNQAANHLIGGQVPTLLGNDHPNIAPYGPLAAADRAVVVGVGNDVQFATLCSILDRGDLTEDDRFRRNTDRVENRDELRRELERSLRARPAEEWVRVLTTAGVPASTIRRVDEVFADDHVRAVGLVAEVEHPDGPVALVRSPLLVDGSRPGIASAPPRLGEHTREVLTALGVRDAFVERFCADGR